MLQQGGSLGWEAMVVRTKKARAAAGDAASDRGAALYREGDPARGTPPCQGCHGVTGEGHAWAAQDASYRTYPKLQGQHAAYVAQRLQDFRDGKHLSSSAERIMTPIAATLDDDATRRGALLRAVLDDAVAAGDVDVQVLALDARALLAADHEPAHARALLAQADDLVTDVAPRLSALDRVDAHRARALLRDR